MVYASSKDRFKRELDGIQVELQATDPSEMSLDIIKGRALKFFVISPFWCLALPINYKKQLHSVSIVFVPWNVYSVVLYGVILNL